MVFHCKPILGASRHQLHNVRKFQHGQSSPVQSFCSHNRYQRVETQHKQTDIAHFTIVQGSSTVSPKIAHLLLIYGFQHSQPNRTISYHNYSPIIFLKVLLVSDNKEMVMTCQKKKIKKKPNKQTKKQSHSHITVKISSNIYRPAIV